MTRDTFVDQWYAENTDELDNEIMNALFTGLAFVEMEDVICDECGFEAARELDDDFGDCYWSGSRFVPKPGYEDEYYG